MVEAGKWNVRLCNNKQTFICKAKRVRSPKSHDVENSSNNIHIKHNKQYRRLREKRSSPNRFSLGDNPFYFTFNAPTNDNSPFSVKDFLDSTQKLLVKNTNKFDDIHRFFNSWSPILESDETHNSANTFDDYPGYDDYPTYCDEYPEDCDEYPDYHKPMHGPPFDEHRVIPATAPYTKDKLAAIILPEPYHASRNPMEIQENFSMTDNVRVHTTIEPIFNHSQFVNVNHPQNDDENVLLVSRPELINEESGTNKANESEYVTKSTGRPFFYLLATTSPAPLCENGWTHSPDLQKCYRVFHHPLTWSRSEMNCKAYGGHLASIGSVREENFIHNMLRTGRMPTLYNQIWIGLSRTCDENRSCQYTWADGNNKTYLNWDTDAEQSNHEIGIIENCGAADLVTMRLTEKKCHTYYPYVCKIQEGLPIPPVNTPTEPPVAYCADDDKNWLFHDAHCYKAVSATLEKKSFWKSRKRCQEEGAELVSIHSLEENHFINSMIYNLSDSALWIGGEANIDSGFHWVDNSSFNFFIWAPDEPSNNDEQESCVTMFTSHNNGYWNDDNCARKMGRICKRPYGTTLPPPATTQAPSGHCPVGWSHLAGRCLQLFGEDNATTWKGARQHCKALAPGADLVSVHNNREQAALTALVAAVGQNAWIGFFNNDGFHWADQSEVDFTHWAAGEPNGNRLRNSRRERCVEVIGSSPQQRGHWNDIRCTVPLGFICHMPTDPNIVIHQPAPTCDGEYAHYFNYSGACYKPVDQHEIWKDAETICTQEGAHLASILDIAENSYIYLLAIDAGLSSVWLGLNSLQDSSGGNHQFSWSDGWPMLLSNWGPGQPNTSLSDHRCAHINTHDGLWYTGKCAGEMPYICKYKNASIPTPDPPTSGRCPDGRWNDLGGSYCYLIQREHKPWNEALRDCIQEGVENTTSNLISIHTQSELDLILQLTAQITDPIWIGLTQFTNGFGWSDGTGLDFINWGESEPNSDEERCGELYTNSGKWNDAACDNPRPFICKTKKTKAMEPKSSLLTEQQPNISSTGSLVGLGSGASAGIIVGVVVSLVFVLVIMGLMAYRYYITPMPDQREYSYSNQSYSDGKMHTSSLPESEDTTQIYEVASG
ncbi:unnamed protein product [Meganyctiphanes norvegica]|uniref:C-type lectin domain-containing protein n=1 Tax=Meganyctiphanes norvegica TaxID=48144 RepID=A0AAV2PU16_MEGNR